MHVVDVDEAPDTLDEDDIGVLEEDDADDELEVLEELDDDDPDELDELDALYI
jgi:hypothetical protein